MTFQLRCLVGGAAAVLTMTLAGCYNNPEVSLKAPGEGPQNYHSRPSVGPGTVPGGSTAGPQPAPRAHQKETAAQPQHSGAPSTPAGH